MDDPFDIKELIARSLHLGRPQFSALPPEVQAQLQSLFDGYMEKTLLNDPKYWRPYAMEAVSIAYAMGRYSVASKVRAVLADDLNSGASSETISSKAGG